MDGIDVSNNNTGPVDFNGQAFAWLKVSEGTGFVDNTFGAFAADATLAGCPYGGYHFAHPDANSAADEARFFLDHYSPRGTVAPALDIEPRGVGAQHRDPLAIMGPAALAQWCDQWCSLVLDATGLEPLQYMDRDYCGHLAPYSQRWPLWLATGDGSRPITYAGRTVAVVQWGQDGGIDRDQAWSLNVGGFLLALTDAEQTELLAIVRAMGEQNYQAPGMSLQFLDDHVTSSVTALIPAIADAVAAKVGSAPAQGDLAVTGTVHVTEEPATAPAATQASSEATTPAPAVESPSSGEAPTEPPASSTPEATPPPAGEPMNP